jgi:hypothetical protein
LPIIPKPADPYLSIQVGEDAMFARYDAIGKENLRKVSLMVLEVGVLMTSLELMQHYIH